MSRSFFISTFKAGRISHRAGIHFSGSGHFFCYRKTLEPNPAGSGHRNWLCRRCCRCDLAAEPRRRRRRRNQEHAGWQYLARYPPRCLEMLRPFSPRRRLRISFSGENFLLVSFHRDLAYQNGLRVRWWDFLFYALFGLVVTSFVRIAGVLLVFSYLIVPAVCGINLAHGSGIDFSSAG